MGADVAPWRRVSGLLAAALVLAGCNVGPVSETFASATTSAAPSGEQPSLSLRDTDVEPIEFQQATLGVAFSEADASELVTDPGGIDFGSDALICVYLGLRPTTGWSLDLRTASLTGAVLSIAARENVPRGNAAAEESYPADCALIDRAALPPGDLTVRADDINSDEFIVDAVVEVPAGESAP
jgi:hypothetical protein